MRLLALLLLLIPGCMLVFGNGRGDECLIAEDTPAGAPAPQRNPDTLTCQTFGGGGFCDPECGPCPELAQAPSPTWGACGSECEALGESDCARKAGCRVVKDAVCATAGGCATDYLGCFPTDLVTAVSIDCAAARDGVTCSQSAACTAYHRGTWRGLEPQVSRTFAMCAPEGSAPGTCFGQVTCLRPPPACPSQTMPGIANGCYTDTCIPNDVCERRP